MLKMQRDPKLNKEWNLKWVISFLVIILFFGCTSHKDMYYLLNKQTNDIEKYPKPAVDYNIIAIDLFDTSKQEISELKSKGLEVICYFSAGSYENWRPDKNNFSRRVLGKKLGAWPGERWLDIKNESVFKIMKKRIDIAAKKGCDGVDFDNVDGYSNDTGFKLTKEDSEKYLKDLSEYAHSKGLKAVLKNALSIIDKVEPYFDYAVNESCHIYHECDYYKPFLKHKKHVFNIEYKPFKRKIKSKYFHSYLADRNLAGKFYKKVE